MATRGLASIFLILSALYGADVDDLLVKARSARAAHDNTTAWAAYDSAFEALAGKPSPRLTAVAVEIADFDIAQQHFTEAESVLAQTLEIEKRASMKPSVVIPVLFNLASLYSRQKQVQDLLPVQTQLVSAWEKQAGADSVVVANNLYRLAGAQIETGQVAEARESMERALTILRAKYGDDAPCIGFSRARLNSIKRKLGEVEPAHSQSDSATATPSGGNPGKGVSQVGANVTSPRPLFKPEPQYSENGRRDNIQGQVILSIVVDESGNPRDIVVWLPLGDGLNEKAVEAVSTWRFSPGMKDGAPVPVQATIEVNFRLL